MIPYGKQSIDESDIDAVVDVLRSNYLTQGPKVKEFEDALANYCGAKYSVVVSNGTAALHTAFVAAGLKPGDEFITSAMTFVATVNAGIWLGAKPVFVDIDSTTGNIDATKIVARITEKTKAIVPIDYTGRPAEMKKIYEIAKKNNLIVIEDAAQSLGGSLKGKKVGTLADLTTLSFHAVKNITTGEGGAILTDKKEYYDIMTRFRTHGVRNSNFVYEKPGDWYFEMSELGLNYRLTDIQAAFGVSQIKRLNSFLEQRREIALRYDQAFKDVSNVVTPTKDTDEVKSAWHLYVLRLEGDLVVKKREIFEKLREKGIWVQVHHIPVHLHPYYRSHFGEISLPETERWYESVISLPIYPDLTEDDQNYVIDTIKKLVLSDQ
jgi:perosamine synthetase